MKEVHRFAAMEFKVIETNETQIKFLELNGAWHAGLSSNVMDVVDVYKRLFGSEPKVSANLTSYRNKKVKKI